MERRGVVIEATERGVTRIRLRFARSEASEALRLLATYLPLVEQLDCGLDRGGVGGAILPGPTEERHGGLSTERPGVRGDNVT